MTAGKRWAWLAARVALTVVAIWVVVGIVHFEDYVRAGDRVAPRTEIESIERVEGGPTVVRWKSGEASAHPAKDVTEHEGFFTLFDRADKSLFFLMLVAFIVPIAFLGLRWWILLRGHGFKVPFGPVFLMNYAGIFFNNFLPGGVGGDLTKAFLATSGEERKAEAVGTILLDRMVGLGVLIFMAAACVSPFLDRFEDLRVPIAIYALAGGVILVYLVYFNPAVRRVVGDRLPFRKTMSGLDEVFRSARERKSLMAGAAGLSILAQGSTIVIAYGLARALGIDSAPLWAFFVFEPIIFILVAMPVSVGGWGVQEGAYAFLFARVAGMMEPNEAIAVSVLFRLCLIAVSIPGGVLFSMGAARVRR